MGIIYKFKVFLIFLICSLALSAYIGYQNNSQNIGIAVFIVCWAFLIGCQYLMRKDKKYTRQAIPQWVKDEVWKIQKGRCAYSGESFESKLDIEWHHVKPVAHGGRSDDPYNIVAVKSEAHNRWTRTRGF